jgi:hypothetical protein
MGFLNRAKDKQSSEVEDAIRKDLGAGEAIVDILLGVNTKRGGKTYLGSLVATNYRIIFRGKYMTGWMTDSHPLDSTTGLTVTIGKVFGMLGVKNGLQVAEYQANGQKLSEFMRAVDAQLDSMKSASDSPTSTTTPATDEIAKLADLHAQGILTDDEFASAKHRIIDRI